MRSKIGIVFAVFVAIILIGGYVLYSQGRTWLYSPIESLTSATVYEVSQGAALNSVLRDLDNRGLIKHPRELSLWLRYSRPGYKLKAGEYELKPGMTPVELIELLNSGRVVLHSLTVVEGATFADFERLLAANQFIRMSTPRLKASDVMKKIGAPAAHPEGYFFPDTYRFPKGTSDVELYAQAYQRMKVELERTWSERNPAVPLASAYEALILASIVEKETALGSERPAIAGVFVDRLRKGMRLQTDPTVIYGIGAAYDGNIRKADLLRDTPYNSYTRAGLPPTPICLPGLDALKAATNPRATGALYFVATGRGDGSHYFSKTLEEHNEAVKRYLRTLKQ
jgi:UPF0755 protein